MFSYTTGAVLLGRGQLAVVDRILLERYLVLLSNIRVSPKP